MPPGVTAQQAQDALVAHLKRACRWNVHVEFEREAVGEPFVGTMDGPAFATMKSAMEEAFGAR